MIKGFIIRFREGLEILARWLTGLAAGIGQVVKTAPLRESDSTRHGTARGVGAGGCLVAVDEVARAISN